MPMGPLAATDNNCYRFLMTPKSGANQPRGHSTPEVMTIDDLASYLQRSKSSLYKLAQDGKVPGQKVGRH